MLRHYGSGTLSSFLGPSCADEQMDHDELLLAPYTTAQANAQINALPAEYGAQGQRAVTMISAYVQGVNAYIAKALTDPALMPAEYLKYGSPKPWTPADVVAVAALVGGIFGDGGGGEIGNAALLRYLQGQLGQSGGTTAFADFKEQNDAGAPTTVVGKSFPYEIPRRVNPATIAVPDNASAPLTGGPVDTTPHCSASAPSKAGLSVIESLLRFPAHMSNALVVGAGHSADGHPLAVFGPQVSYFDPGILMQEDMHSPDYAAEGRGPALDHAVHGQVDRVVERLAADGPVREPLGGHRRALALELIEGAGRRHRAATGVADQLQALVGQVAAR